MKFLLNYCRQLSPAQLVQLYYYHKESPHPGAKVFSAWAYLTAKKNLKCFAGKVEKCERKLEGLEGWMFEHLDESSKGIDIKAAKLPEKKSLTTTTTLALGDLIDEYINGMLDFDDNRIIYVNNW